MIDQTNVLDVIESLAGLAPEAPEDDFQSLPQLLAAAAFQRHDRAGQARAHLAAELPAPPTPRDLVVPAARYLRFWRRRLGAATPPPALAAALALLDG